MNQNTQNDMADTTTTTETEVYDPYARKPGTGQGINGNLRAGGKPGNKGGYRHKEQVRIKASAATAQTVDKLSKVLKAMLTEIEREQAIKDAEGRQAKGNSKRVLDLIRESTKLWTALGNLGIGTKVETTLGSTEFIDVVARVLNDVVDDPILKSEVLVRLKDELKG